MNSELAEARRLLTLGMRHLEEVSGWIAGLNQSISEEKAGLRIAAEKARVRLVLTAGVRDGLGNAMSLFAGAMAGASSADRLLGQTMALSAAYEEHAGRIAKWAEDLERKLALLGLQHSANLATMNKIGDMITDIERICRILDDIIGEGQEGT